MKILISGRPSLESIERSYQRAFQARGHQVITWDVPTTEGRHTRLGKVGRYLNYFWPAEPWVAKANAEFLSAVFDHRPDIVFVTGAWRVLAGTLAQVKTFSPDCQLVFLWPDTLLNCHSHTLACIPIFDLIASYSSASADAFYRLGARRVEWVPLAFDPHLHAEGTDPKGDPRFTGTFDISFVGNYTAEREKIIQLLAASGVRVGVWGEPAAWKSPGVPEIVRRCYRGGPLWSADFATAVKSAPLSLNPIARSNFPAANMRFFEIPGAGGTAVSASCPEMEPEFPDLESCFYYRDPGSVVKTVRAALADPARRALVAAHAHSQVLAAHTYAHRATLIVDLLKVNA